MGKGPLHWLLRVGHSYLHVHWRSASLCRWLKKTCPVVFGQCRQVTIAPLLKKTKKTLATSGGTLVVKVWCTQYFVMFSFDCFQPTNIHYCKDMKKAPSVSVLYVVNLVNLAFFKYSRWFLEKCGNVVLLSLMLLFLLWWYQGTWRQQKNLPQNTQPFLP